MKRGRWQAKDIDDRFFLACVEWASREALPPQPSQWKQLPWEPRACPHWVFTWNLECMLPVFPVELIRAKAGALIRRGLLDGCDCGCRGDFELTPAGAAFLATGEK